VGPRCCVETVCGEQGPRSQAGDDAGVIGTCPWRTRSGSRSCAISERKCFEADRPLIRARPDNRSESSRGRYTVICVWSERRAIAASVSSAKPDAPCWMPATIMQALQEFCFGSQETPMY